MSDRASDSGSERKGVISNATPVTLGIVIASVGAIVTGAGTLIGAIWWAATLQTKLDTVIEEFHQTQKAAIVLEGKLGDMEHRITVIEARLKP